MLTRLSLFSLCGSMDLSISKHSDERGGEVALFVVLGISLLDKLLGVLISRFERIYHYLFLPVIIKVVIPVEGSRIDQCSFLLVYVMNTCMYQIHVSSEFKQARKQPHL